MAIATQYADYHRTVIGFHGTTEATATKLVNGRPFKSSDSEDDWLGKGAYFWEHAPKQAWWWARQFKRNEKPAVVGTIIRLGNCCDLLDPANLAILKQYHGALLEKFEIAGIETPTNARQHRKLDCAVFNFFCGELEAEQRPVDAIRGVYVPTDGRKRIWKGSWIYDAAHIQICVKNPANILAVWHVRPDGRYGKTRSRNDASRGN